MIPLYFGAGDQQLFGIYEPARRSGGAKRAAVLCNPPGSEYVHAHRAIRNLALRLSKAGLHVLRFDYYGTGDSAGDSDEGNPHRWCDDIEAAMSELKDMTGAMQVTLIGLRFGANLAARVAGRDLRGVEALVLWEPLASGHDSVASLPKDHADIALPIDLAMALPSRTLVLLTAQDTHTVDFGRCEVGHVPSPSPWVDSFFEPEVIPVNALAFIVKWLSS
jgi:alpha/beta superfamily hydrolase